MLPQRYRDAIGRELRYLWRRLRQPALVEVHGVRLATEGCEPSLRNTIFKDEYERAELGIIGRTLAPDDIVLEIGAGLGLISAYCAKRLGDGGQVHCFEANPAMAPAIRRTHELNGVQPHLVIGCVSTHDGSQDFFVEESFYSSSTRQRSAQATKVTVPSHSLQRLLGEIRPTYLVIDAEGAEADLLPGVDLAVVRKISIELHPHIIGNEACTTVIGGLIAQGFQLDIDLSDGRVAYFCRPARHESLSAAA